MTTAFHVLAGGLALGAGYVALAAAKGGRLHRRSGTAFVATMLAMAASGLVIAVAQNAAPAINVPAALLTAYLVATGFAAVQAPSARRRRFDVAAMRLALAGGLVSVAYGATALAAGRPSRGIIPIVFGAIALAAALADRRMLRTTALHGAPRLTRHLWRLCTALLIASLAFFVGQSDEFPAAWRIPALLATPVLAVLAAMLVWIWRLRRRGAPAARRPWFARLDLDDEDFRDEIRAHLAMATAERVAGGADPETARFAALREFGNVTLTTEAARRVWTPPWLERLRDLASDVRYALRTLLKHPAFSLTVVAVLTLGIGLNAAVFTMLKGIAFTPIGGVERSASLTVVFPETERGRALRVSYPDYVHLREQQRAFTGLFGSALAQVTLGRGRAAHEVSAELVTGDYFQILGIGAALGRTLLPSDEIAPGRHPVVVLGHGLWQREFGGDPAIVGTTITVNRQALTVAGVAEPAFHGTIVSYDIELFIPVLTAPDLGFTFGSQATTPSGILADPRAALFYPQGFLRPGISRAQAADELGRLWAARAGARPIGGPDLRLRAVPFSQSPGSGQTYILPTLTALATMGLLVLLIACANIAGLVLVRGMSRRGEIAVRLALGASRPRIVRLLVIENLTLAAPGALLGLALSWQGIPPLVQYAEWLAAPQRLYFNIDVDAVVIGFAALTACACALVFGFVPAIQSTRVDLVSVINEDASPRGAARGRFRAGLVVAQVAVSLLLMVGAGLAMRSVDAARSADPGFDVRGVALAQVNVRQQGYDAERGRVFFRALLDAARTQPGVDAATLAEHLPLGLLETRAQPLAVEGHQPRQGEDLAIPSNAVGPDYFRTLRIGVAAGREFEDRDDRSGAPVAIVNRTLAERFFGTAAGALGQRVRVGEDEWRTVIGVAADVKYARINEAPRPYVYVPALQVSRPVLMVHVRGSGPVEALVEKARAAVAAVDAEMPVLDAGSMAHETRGAFIFFDLLATMLPIFAVAGMALAALGTYGLVSYVVTQSIHEIGIRMALGATRASIVGGFVGRGLRLGVVGAALGVVGALAVSRLLAGVLFGVSATDTASFATALAVVLGGVGIATLLPAWRAARTNPLAALRHD